jgi:hypothetical protein
MGIDHRPTSCHSDGSQPFLLANAESLPRQVVADKNDRKAAKYRYDFMK